VRCTCCRLRYMIGRFTTCPNSYTPILDMTMLSGRIRSSSTASRVVATSPCEFHVHTFAHCGMHRRYMIGLFTYVSNLIHPSSCYDHAATVCRRIGSSSTASRVVATSPCEFHVHSVFIVACTGAHAQPGEHAQQMNCIYGPGRGHSPYDAVE